MSTPRARFVLAAAIGCTFVLFLSGCSTDHDHAAKSTHEGSPASAHWSYAGATGPTHWSTLDAANFAAAKGASQSPIDISTGKSIKAELPALEFTSAPIPLGIVNNGHTVQVKGSAANSFRFGDQTYSLAQLHFHSPSEHTIDTKHAAIEMHMVHESADGHAAVIAVMIVEGTVNKNFDSILGNLPTEAGPERSVAGVTVNPGTLLPEDRDYFFYDGSLTTPPCTEGIRWFVLKTPIQMSAEQIATFHKAFNSNNRPVQPPNARIILRK